MRLKSALVAALVAAEEDKRTMTPRIINGEAHSIADYPWLVSLWAPSADDFPSHCGGAILHQNWIVTAAHCLFADSKSTSFMSEITGTKWLQSLFIGDSVKVGMTRQDQSSESFGVFEKKIISGHCHPDFSRSSQGELYADICLLRIETILDHEFTAVTGSSQKKICLPRSNTPPRNCHVAGWGVTDKEVDQSESNHLLAAHMPPIDYETCSAWYAVDDFELESDSHKCFGHENGLHDSCQGDSGGPAMCYNSALGQWEIHGIVSFAYECGAEQRPGVYTNVYNYAQWISETINQYHPEANFTDATCHSCFISALLTLTFFVALL